MKILVVSQYYYPEQFLINEIAPELVKRGHEVVVLTGLPNYPEGVVPKEYQNGKKRNEEIDGVRIIRTFESGRGKGAATRVFNALSYMASASWRVLLTREKFDAVFCYFLSPLTSLVPALLYKKLHKTPVLLYCCDLWPDSLCSFLKNEKSLVAKFAGFLTRLTHRRADVVVVATRLFIDYMRRVNKIPLEKLRYCPQHSSEFLLNEELDAKDNGVADFMYAGNLGYYQQVDVIIKATSLLKERNDFKVHIVGDGSCREELIQQVRNANLEDKVVFYDRVPFSQMAEKYRLADALLLTLGGKGEVGKTIPAKLQTYMTTGKPIFGAIDGGAKEIVEESKCGKVVSAGDYEGLARLMKDYIENPSLFAGLGSNGKKYFRENFTLKQSADFFENELRGLVARN